MAEDKKFQEGDLVREHFKPNEVIALEGEATNGLYLLEFGEVEVLKGSESISIISEPYSFFGEMSFLVNEKRTATLKAKTDVTAIRIQNTDDLRALLTKIPDKIITLMKTLAQRLDLVNYQLEEEKKFRQFYDIAHRKAKDEKREDTLSWFSEIEKEIDIVKKKKDYDLIRQYLLTPRVWGVLKEAIVGLIYYHTKEVLTLDYIDVFDESELDFQFASWIDYKGDIKGGLAFHINKPYAAYLSECFGFNPNEIDEDSLCGEMANQILGALKGKLKSLEIEMSNPTPLDSKEKINEQLKHAPALRITLYSKRGEIELLFQIDALIRQEFF